MENGIRAKTGSRYRSLILSITMFLILFSVILLVSIFSSVRIQKANQTVIEAGNMQTGIQTIMKELYNIKLYYGEDPHSPVVQASLNNLRENQKAFNERLAVFSTGGTLLSMENGSGDQQEVNIEALTDSGMQSSLNNLKQHWAPLNQALDTYLKDAQSITSSNTPLDLAVISSQDNNATLVQEVTTLANTVQQSAQRTASILRWVQAIAIVVALLYFVVFIRYFMRKLQAADLRAAQAQKEIEEIMGTVDSGLFLLDSNLNIGSQYSDCLTRILERKEIAGLSLPQLLKDLVDENSLEMTQRFVKQLYNHRVKEHLIADLNPLNRVAITLAGKDGVAQTKWLSFHFNRVHEQNEIRHILVSVTDITDAVLLEQRLAEEQEQNNTQSQMLTSLVNTEPSIMRDFIEKANRYCREINQTLKNQNNTQPAYREKVDAIYREVHDLKGEASALKLQSFVNLTEDFENQLSTMKQKSRLTGEDFLPLAVYLEELLTLSSTISQLSGRLGQHGSGASKTTPATAFKNHIEQFAHTLALRHNKKVGVSFSGTELLNELMQETISTIREVVVQLLRNSVVHGLETPQERTAARKSAVGHIHVAFSKENNTLYFSVEDDGRGIDYARVRAKAAACVGEEKAAQMNIQELQRLMFSSGFSTLEEHNEDAGRGVGLDAVKNSIVKLNGKIRLVSAPNVYTQFMFQLPAK